MQTCAAFQQRVVQVNDLTFWTESFGNPTDPAVLLIMGSAAQCILWPQQFVEQLAARGFFVIRFDNRDVGLSSTMDFQQSPYTLLDMANDAVGILDNYQLKQAHVVGASLGGVIGMLLAAHFSDRVSSLSLLMTTTDLLPAFDALVDKPSNGGLSQPTPEYAAWLKKYMVQMPVTLDDKVQYFMEGAQILAGPKVKIDRDKFYQIGLQIFARMKNPISIFNHMKAMATSHVLHMQAPHKIKAPILIVHGDQDPILPADHGKALKQAFPHADYVAIHEMGHALSPPFFDIVVKKIEEVTKAPQQV
jgi:pimeloyl-ACP methyl ester carboxylesterase